MHVALGQPTALTIPTVVTGRLVLRCWKPDDIDPYAAMNADALTMRYLNGPFDRAATERLVTHLIGMWALRGHGMWAVEDRSGGDFVGRAGLYVAEGWPGVEVAVSVRRDRWGQGLGTEACHAAITWGFSTLPLSRVIMFTNRQNAGMNAIGRKLDMRYDGPVDAIGPWKDNSTYSVERASWPAALPPTPSNSPQHQDPIAQ